MVSCLKWKDLLPILSCLKWKDLPTMVSCLKWKDLPPMMSCLKWKDLPPMVSYLKWKDLPPIVSCLKWKDLRPVDNLWSIIRGNYDIIITVTLTLIGVIFSNDIKFLFPIEFWMNWVSVHKYPKLYPVIYYCYGVRYIVWTTCSQHTTIQHWRDSQNNVQYVWIKQKTIYAASDENGDIPVKVFKWVCYNYCITKNSIINHIIYVIYTSILYHDLLEDSVAMVVSLSWWGIVQLWL